MLIEDATSDRDVRENLINQVNVQARPMSGWYDVDIYKEVRVRICDISLQPVHISRDQIIAAGGSVEQNEEGEEVFVIPVKKPVPSR